MKLHERFEIGDVVISRVGRVVTVYRQDVKSEQKFYPLLSEAESAFKTTVSRNDVSI